MIKNTFVSVSILFILASSLSFSHDLISKKYQTIESVIETYYKAVSGPAGKHDWSLMREICLPNAQFNAMGITAEGTNRFHPQSMEEYFKHLGKYLENYGFYQEEIFRRVDRYANIAHVFSTFQSRMEPEGDFIDKGVFSFQLIYDKERWWIANVLWHSATKENPIPEEFLK